MFNGQSLRLVQFDDGFVEMCFDRGGDVIDKFEKRFGGAEAMRQTFSNYVDQMRVGNGIEDVKWAQDHLQRWSGWV